MSDRNILDLCLQLKPLADQFIDRTNAAIASSTCKISVTWRSSSDQNDCKSHGLSNAGAGQSPHNCTLNGEPASRAFDFAIFDQAGKYVTDGQDDRYTTAGNIAKSLGLIWGGDFTHPDYDHVELAEWKSL